MVNPNPTFHAIINKHKFTVTCTNLIL